MQFIQTHKIKLTLQIDSLKFQAQESATLDFKIFYGPASIKPDNKYNLKNYKCIIQTPFEIIANIGFNPETKSYDANKIILVIFIKTQHQSFFHQVWLDQGATYLKHQEYTDNILKIEYRKRIEIISKYSNYLGMNRFANQQNNQKFDLRSRQSISVGRLNKKSISNDKKKINITLYSNNRRYNQQNLTPENQQSLSPMHVMQTPRAQKKKRKNIFEQAFVQQNNILNLQNIKSQNQALKIQVQQLQKYNQHLIYQIKLNKQELVKIEQRIQKQKKLILEDNFNLAHTINLLEQKFSILSYKYSILKFQSTEYSMLKQKLAINDLIDGERQDNKNIHSCNSILEQYDYLNSNLSRQLLKTNEKIKYFASQLKNLRIICQQDQDKVKACKSLRQIKNLQLFQRMKQKIKNIQRIVSGDSNLYDNSISNIHKNSNISSNEDFKQVQFLANELL